MKQFKWKSFDSNSKSDDDRMLKTSHSPLYAIQSCACLKYDHNLQMESEFLPPQR